MTRTILFYITLAVMAIGASTSAHDPGSSRPRGNATIQGRVLSKYPQGMQQGHHVPVYLFTLQQSKRLRELDRQAFERATRPGADQGEIARATTQLFDAFADLVPKLPRTALTKTDDAQGFYRFQNVPPGRRYYVMAWVVMEDGTFLAAGVTPVLKTGDNVAFDLRDDTPWGTRFQIK